MDDKSTLVKDVVAAYAEILASTGKPPNTVVLPLSTIESVNPELAERLRAAGPDVEVPIDPPTAPEPEEEEPVRHLTLGQPRTKKPKPPALYFYMTDMGVVGNVKVKTSEPIPVPAGLPNWTIPFNFVPRIGLEGNLRYRLLLLENGLNRVEQGFMLERDAEVGYIKTVISRPKSPWANLQVQVRTQNDTVVAQSVRVQVGRQR